MSRFVYILTFVLFMFLENHICRTARSVVSKGDITNIGNLLWEQDNRVRGIIFHLQGEFASNETNLADDRAPASLFAALREEVLNRSTFVRMFSLLDNYETNTKVPENETQEENVEVEEFLDSVIETNVMKTAWNFLIEKNFSSSSKTSFQDQLRSMWFGLYPRGHRVNSSCGFEHVFRGEIRNSKVVGFHNWMRFYLAEKDGEVDYKGHYNTLNIGKGHVIQSKLSWGRYVKPVTTFFIGTTPEFELALYTVCFYSRPNGVCRVKLNRKKVRIQTHKIYQNGISLVGTAYPII